MIVKSLYMQVDGTTLVSGACHEYANVVRADDPTLVETVLRRLFVLPYEIPSRENGIMASAIVETDELFLVEIHQRGWWDPQVELIVREYGVDTDSDCTADYVETLFQNGEESEFTVFREFASGSRRHRLRTASDAVSARFREQWIRGYQPVRLRDGKPYWIHLDADGTFTARDETSGDPVMLSETDMLLYHLHCFYETAAYMEALRSLKGEPTCHKPLLVEGLSERLDRAVDLCAVWDMAQRYQRQTFFVVTDRMTDTEPMTDNE